MSETNIQPSKKTTKICLKCGRGLRSNQEKCNSCQCEDIMDKKEYSKLVEEYERADINKKTQMRNNPNYAKFFKYKYTQVQTQKDFKENKVANKDDLYDTLKIIGSLISLVIGVILWIYLTINLNALIGLIVDICFILLSLKFLSSISNKTKQETSKIIKTQEEQKKHQELHGGYKCPNCGEYAGHEIGTVKKAISIGTLGLISDKIGKNYECKNCGYKW